MKRRWIQLGIVILVGTAVSGCSGGGNGGDDDEFSWRDLVGEWEVVYDGDYANPKEVVFLREGEETTLFDRTDEKYERYAIAVSSDGTVTLENDGFLAHLQFTDGGDVLSGPYTNQRGDGTLEAFRSGQPGRVADVSIGGKWRCRFVNSTTGRNAFFFFGVEQSAGGELSGTAYQVSKAEYDAGEPSSPPNQKLKVRGVVSGERAYILFRYPDSSTLIWANAGSVRMAGGYATTSHLAGDWTAEKEPGTALTNSLDLTEEYLTEDYSSEESSSDELPHHSIDFQTHNYLRDQLLYTYSTIPNAWGN